MVNTSVNGVGGVGNVDSTSSNVFYFDPNIVGSTIGIDEDGNGTYEREDALLAQIVANEYDEIAMYSISHILSTGDEMAANYDIVNQPTTPYDNIMGDQERMDWHVARFVYKAKTQYGLDVLAMVSQDDPEPYKEEKYRSRFYNYFTNYARSGSVLDTQMVEDMANYYINKYEDAWQNNPADVGYVRYDADTLIFPKDAEGRISNIDKMVIDVVNLNLFEYRVKSGFIELTQNSGESKIGTGENRCDNGFDGHLFEWEWWSHDNHQDNSLGFLIQLIQFSKSLQEATDVCYPAHYVCQDEFDGNSDWSTDRTEQQRADMVDKNAERIYLYSYHKNPCDCYWGRGQDTQFGSQDFKYKAQLLRNNTFGADNGTGETFIIPVFNPKFKCSDYEISTDIPVYYGDGKKGCNGAPGCDFNKRYSGTALEHLRDTSAYQPWLGYVENIFQEQYDFDFYNTSEGYSDNHIFGYCWFKLRLLTDNGYINSVAQQTAEIPNMLKVYPNPSESVFRIEGNNELITRVEVYSITGSLVQNAVVNDASATIEVKESGTYFLKVYLENGSFETHKIIRW